MPHITLFKISTTIIGLLCLRLFVALNFPLTNDEAYYWDWGRFPLLSYLDHPTGVGIQSYLSQKIVSTGNLSARILCPFIQIFTSLFMGFAAYEYSRQRQSSSPQAWFAFICASMLCQSSLYLSGIGIFILPDTGLMLGLSVAVLACVHLSNEERKDPKKTVWSFYALLGLGLGAASLFKYHGLMIGLSMIGSLALFKFRRKKIYDAVLGSLLAISVMTLGFLPVILWNIEHQGASLRFQGSHTLAWNTLHFYSGLRMSLAIPLLFGPLLVFQTWNLLTKKSWFTGSSQDSVFALAQGLVILFFCINAFFTESLPHWVAPAMVLSIPFASYQMSRGHVRFYKLQLSIFAILGVATPLFFSIPKIRENLYDRLPALKEALWEISIWPELAKLDTLKTDELSPVKFTLCPQNLFATTRWYWSAQMAFHLDKQPRVINLDHTRASYYWFRDNLVDLKGCPAKLIASKDQYNPKAIAKFATVVSEQHFTIEDFKKMPLVLAEIIIDQPEAFIEQMQSTNFKY